MSIIGIIGGGLITVFIVLLAVLIWQEYKDEKKRTGGRSEYNR